MLIEVGLVIALLLVAFAGGHKRDTPGAARNLWAWIGLAAVELFLLPSGFLKVLLVGILINIYRIPQPASQDGHVVKVVGVTAAYILLLPYIPAGADVVVLWTLASIGVLLGLHTIFSFWYVWYYNPLTQSLDKEPTLYNFMRQVGPVTVQVSEHRLLPGGYTCGQLMPNWLHAEACLAVAATCGLTIQGYQWAWLLMPLTLIPILATVPCGFTRRFNMAGPINQCAIHLLTLLCALAMVVNPVFGLTVWLLYLVGVAAVVYRQYHHHFPKWVDSGRLEEWYNMLKYWVLLKTWDVYIFGHGIRSWVVLSQAKSQLQQGPAYFSMAHNEYIQHLFEYGILGFVSLVGYTLSYFYYTYHYSIGLYLVGSVMVSVALVSFPWSFFHVIKTQGQDQQGRIVFVRYDNYGSPLLFWVTFVLNVC